MEDKMIKVLALTTNQLLITEIIEVAAVDIGAPDCKLVSPYIIKDNEDSPNLEPFLWGVTKETTFMLSSDKILTLCDPSPTLLEKYQDIIK